MRKLLFYIIAVLFLFSDPLLAAVIQGKLVSLDPLTKSIRITRINESGKEEQIDIGVPDGVSYSGSAPSFAELPVGANLSVTVNVGERPGSWDAVTIQEVQVVVKKPKVAQKTTPVKGSNIKKIDKMPEPEKIDSEKLKALVKSKDGAADGSQKNKS